MLLAEVLKVSVQSCEFYQELVVRENSLVLLAKIVSAHGILGRVKLRTFTEYPRNIEKYDHLTDGHSCYKIEILSVLSNNLVIGKIEGVSSRTEAERLKGKDLYIKKENLPDDLKEDEHYIDDLIGMEVRLYDGVLYGHVSDVDNFGSCDIISISLNKNPQKTQMLPFLKEIFISVDKDQQVISIKLPESIEDGQID